MLFDEDPEVLAHTPNASSLKCYPLLIHYSWLEAPIIKHNCPKNSKDPYFSNTTQDTTYSIQQHVTVFCCCGCCGCCRYSYYSSCRRCCSCSLCLFLVSYCWLILSIYIYINIQYNIIIFLECPQSINHCFDNINQCVMYNEIISGP